MRIALQLTARLCVGLLLATLSFGCSTPTQIQVDPDTDFSRYRTWGWQPNTASSERVRPNSLDLQVARQIQRALLERGLHYAPTEPDLRVSASLLVTREKVIESRTSAVRRLSSMHESGSFDVQATETVIRFYERGLLVVEVSDAVHRGLVWRGEIEGRYREALGPHIDEVVESLVGRFPMIVPAANATSASSIAQAGDAAVDLSGRRRR